MVLAGSAGAQQGAIDLFVGETLFVGGTRLSTTYLHAEGGGLRSGRRSIANPRGVERNRNILVLGLAHGLRRGTDVTLLAPFLRTDATFADGMGMVDTDHAALGDISVTLRQRVHHHVWERSAWSTSLLGGTQFPTGDDGERQNGVLLPPELQAGSGSFDPYAGLATTLELDRLRVDSSLFYVRPTEGSQNFESGDVLSASISAGYRVVMNRYPGPTVSLKGGLRYRREGRARLDGNMLPSSGRQELACRAAITYHPYPDWDVVVTLELPFYQDVHGSQTGVDYRMLVGLGWRF